MPFCETILVHSDVGSEAAPASALSGATLRCSHDLVIGVTILLQFSDEGPDGKTTHCDRSVII